MNANAQLLTLRRSRQNLAKRLIAACRHPS
jgi:hypothetical protein